MSNHYFAMLSRMKYIARWALMRNVREENLSEHSLETAFIAHALCKIANVRLGGSLNPDRAAVLAMFHDTTEIITGDLPTPIKYKNEQIKAVYKEIEHSAAEKLLELLPDDLKPEYAEIYNENDKELLLILRAADKISALIKCIEEGRMGNDEFKIAEKSCKKAIEELNCEPANIFVEEFLGSYRLTLDEMNGK